MMTAMNRVARLTPVVMILVAAAVLGGCASRRPPATPAPETTGPRFSLELTPGPYYKTTTGWFVFKLPVYPQVAAWVETTDGKYLGTIYVTGKAGRNGWIQAPSAGRPEALPVWSGLRQGKLDAVSAATSAGETVRGSDLAAGLPAGDYAVMLETNRSYDYNAAYSPSASGVCGQPSIVYRAVVTVGNGPSEGRFEPVGTGSVDGSDHLVHPGLSGIDTALALFSGMAIGYRD